MGLSDIRDLCAEAAAALDRGDGGGARALAEAALARCEAELGAGHWAHAFCLWTAGWAREAAGDRAGAAAAFEAVEARLPELEAVDWERALTAVQQLARFRAVTGDAAAARRLAGDAVALAGRHLGVEHPRYWALRAAAERG